MKGDIHPDYMDCSVTCGCGSRWKTRSTVAKITVEICGVCHPFYTGQQKYVDAAGRIERFQKKYGGSYFREKGAKREGAKPAKA